jgi:hypothetical protein
MAAVPVTKVTTAGGNHEPVQGTSEDGHPWVVLHPMQHGHGVVETLEAVSFHL